MAEAQAPQHKDLTKKQARFVREYLVDLNATQAAIRAGYSKKTAGAIGGENLEKPTIRTAVLKAIDERAATTKVTAERVLLELARIAFCDIRDLFEWNEESAAFIPSRDLSADEAASISAIESETTTVHFSGKHGRAGETETKIKLKLRTYDKTRSLELLGKHLAMFTDRRGDEFGGEPAVFIVPGKLDPDEWAEMYGGGDASD